MKKDYVVLARKYRPQNFTDLKGQDALVTTISNSIKTNRIAHAFMFTGIRGVGKTTSARIVAKTLNCIGIDGNANEPQINPCGVCKNCTAITNDNHPDVIEMDAASHTGVDDIRSIIEQVHYLPVISRYKIIIIDEVHMLSNSAFNALLKTLEEPPLHVKFIFATTELRKIPITIISRCQRFDLRRLSEEEITEHLQNITNMENVKANIEALELISHLSEGSVRDSLSILDQAINISGDNKEISLISVQNMLGIGTSNKCKELFAYLITGQVSEALKISYDIYLGGSDPVQIGNELLNICHELSKKIMTDADNIEDEFLPIKSKITIPILTRLWQIMQKSIAEIKSSANHFAALEMIIIRICYCADLPHLGKIDKDGDLEIKQPEKKTKNTQKVEIKNFEDITNLCVSKKNLFLYQYLYEDVHLVDFAPNNITLNIKDTAPKDLVSLLKEFLYSNTGERWQINVVESLGEKTLGQQEKDKFNIKIEELKKDEMVKEVFQHFPDAEIVSIS
jgi:DNA polymerase III subunit gamma/tau